MFPRNLSHHPEQVELYRDGPKASWGFRLKGGRDVDGGSPLEITRVAAGGASEGILFPGDRVVAINHVDTARLTHMEAQKLMQNAGTNVKLNIVRTYQNNLIQNNVTAMNPNQISEVSKVHAQTIYPPPLAHHSMASMVNTEVDSHQTNDAAMNVMAVLKDKQSHRTAPLITPKELDDRTAGFNPVRRQEQFHQNAPSVQPAGLSPQSRTIHVGGSPKKVVSGQFNSPLHIYSDEAIAEAALHNRNLMPEQSRSHPGFVETRHKLPHPKDATLSHPHQSETFKLILESELGEAKDHPKMFGHEFHEPPKDGRPNSQLSNKSIDVDPVMFDNSINQSASFKRIMYSIMGETTEL